ncbi:unnamed protein product [Boreogadus saida]
MGRPQLRSCHRDDIDEVIEDYRWPLPRGYTGTMEATTLVLLVLLDCLLVSSSRPFRSSSGGPPMVSNFIKSDVEES